MEELMEVSEKLAFFILVAWVIFAGFGLAKMPELDSVSKPKSRNPMEKANGGVWAHSVVSAPMANTNLSGARIM